MNANESTAFNQCNKKSALLPPMVCLATNGVWDDVLNYDRKRTKGLVMFYPDWQEQLKKTNPLQ